MTTSSTAVRTSIRRLSSDERHKHNSVIDAVHPGPIARVYIDHDAGGGESATRRGSAQSSNPSKLAKTQSSSSVDDKQSLLDEIDRVRQRLKKEARACAHEKGKQKEQSPNDVTVGNLFRGTSTAWPHKPPMCAGQDPRSQQFLQLRF